MAAAHHAAQRPAYSYPPPPGYNDDLRLPSIKDLHFAYERPRQDTHPPPPPQATHTSQPLPEYTASSQERSVHHTQSSWKRPTHHPVPPPAMPAHHQQHLPQQHNPPLSVGHEVTSRPEEYPPKHHDSGYMTPASTQMTHVPGSVSNGAPVRGDDHTHLHPNKRARTSSSTPIISSRDTRPQQPHYSSPYQHLPQYQVAPPPPSPYPPVSSAPPTIHQAPPPPSPHDMHHHHHQQSHHGYSQYGQQQYAPARPVHLPPHHAPHHIQPQHTTQHTSVAAPPPPPPPTVQSQPPPNSQPVSYSSSAPPTAPAPAPPPDHWEHHQSHQPHQPPAPVHHVHHQPPQPPPPPSHAPVQHGHPPQHYSHHPPPPQQHLSNAPASTPAPPPQVYPHPPPIHAPPTAQHPQTFTRSSIAPSEIEHRTTPTSYASSEQDKNPAREKMMTEIVKLCAILYDFASRYAQLNAALPSAQPSPTEIAEMANKANEVVRLLEELRRMNMPEAERVKQPENAPAAPVAATTMSPSPDDHRPPKRPWEDMSQDGQAPAQTESSGMFAEPYSASASSSAPAPDPVPTVQSTAEQDMELIRTKRATTAAGAAASAGQPKTKYRKRSRATPPGKCHSCNIKETPEWRRGPDGARTLCNACGLHYAKLMRKQSKLNPGPNGEPPPPIDMDTLRASTRAAEADKNSRQKADSDRHASPTTNSTPATPLTSQHHQGSFQIIPVQPDQANSTNSSSSSSEARTTHLALGQPPPPPWTSRSFNNAPSEQLQHQSFLRSSHGNETSPR